MSQTLIPINEIDSYLDPRLWTICTAAILNKTKKTRNFKEAIKDIDIWLNDINNLSTVIEYHGLSGLMYSLSKHTQLNLPMPAAMVIKASTAKHSQRWQAITHVLENINTIAGDIDFCLLKGSALTSDIYDSPYERAMSDIDIMCSPENALLLYQKCLENGFSATETIPTELVKHHHLPAVFQKIGQHSIYLEIHTHALSHDLKDQLHWQDIQDQFRTIHIAETTFNILQHEVMLLQLCVHAFARDQVIKLSNIVDIFRYSIIHEKDIDWQKLALEYPQVILIMRYARLLLELPSDVLPQVKDLNLDGMKKFRGLGEGMLPLREFQNTEISTIQRFKMLFFPSPWWQCIFYRVEPSLEKHKIRLKTAFSVRYVLHPINIIYWTFSKVILPNIMSKKISKANLSQVSK